MDLEPGVTVWDIKLPRSYLFSIPSKTSTDQKALVHITSAHEHCPRIQESLEFLAAFYYTLECRRVTANGKVDFLSHLPQAGTEENTSKACHLSHPEDVEIHLVGFSNLWLHIPRNRSDGVSVLGGLLLVHPSSVLDRLYSDDPLARVRSTRT